MFPDIRQSRHLHAPSRAYAFFRRAVSLVVLTALSTCASLTHIDVQADGKASIPRATLVDKLLGSLSFAGFDTIDFSEEFRNQGVSKGDVDTVHMKSFTITLDSPVTGTLDFLESVSFFAESNGLPKVKIASISSVPNGARQLDLTVDTSVDLEPYVVAPSMRISGQATGGRPDEDTELGAHVVLDVDVNIPGCN